MSLDKKDELEIEAIVVGGDGIARREDGCVVFVARAAPGERVEVEYTHEHRQWRRARITRIVRGAPERRPPSCPHFAACGGCQLQHLDYAAQLSAKSAIICDALRRLGGIDIAPPDVVPSPRRLYYRNRVSFVLRRGDGVVAGFHRFDDPAAVVDVDRCPLAEAPVNDAWSSLRESWGPAARSLPRGEELRLTLRAGAGDRVGMAVEHGHGGGDIDELVEKVAGLGSVWLVNDRGDVYRHAGDETLIESAGSFEIPLAGTAFVQVNRHAAAAMNDYVLEQCGDVSKARVIDAYCGFGSRSLALAGTGAVVTGIDVDRHAIDAAARLAGDTGLPARFVAARVERALARELPADAVVLNPPRNGVDGDVAAALVRRPVDRLVYVSCNPATLARDLGRLSSRYRLVACRAFDLFPQTAHVETVVTMLPHAADAEASPPHPPGV